MTETHVEEAATAKRARTKKADMPVKMAYVDAAGNELERLSDAARSVRVKIDEHAYDLKVREIPDKVIWTLAINNVYKMLRGLTREVTKGQHVEVHNIVNGYLDNAKNGQLFVATAADKPRGRPTDYTFWVDVLAESIKYRIEKGNTDLRPMSHEARADLLAKLQGMSIKEFNVTKKAWMAKDKVFAWKAKEMAAARAEQKLSEIGDDDYNPLAELDAA